jgi:uncharacterized membrane protein
MLPLLLEAQPHTDRELVWLGEWSLAWKLGVLAAAALVLALTAYNYRGFLPRWRAVGLWLLRCLAVAMLVGVFYQPGCLEQQIETRANHTALLIDASGSMSLKDGGFPSHLDRVRAFLDTHAAELAEIGAQSPLEIYSFAETLEDAGPGDPAEVARGLESTGRSTRIMKALGELSERRKDRDLGAVVLLTDGIDTEKPAPATLSPSDQAVLAEIDAPISSFLAGTGEGSKDVRIASLSSSNFAFVMNATTVEAEVEVHGPVTGPITVRLTVDGEEVARQTHPILTGTASYPVHLEVVPRRVGKAVYAVSVDPSPGEIELQNNHRLFVVNVIRDKIRILQVVGQPSWDERFLRNFLKKNPSVDLISFFILVNPQGINFPGPDETSLIPFPAQELFEQELGGFDLVVFQNFNYGPFQTRVYLPLIAQYVRDGGAFLMIGGPRSLSAGGYYGTALMDVLPVDIAPDLGGEATLDTGSYRARLAEAGHFHPVTRLALDPEANARVWRELLPLEGLNLSRRLKRDAVALVVHPTLVGEEYGQPQPVVAVREVGKGRSLVVATDSTWHWSFKAGLEGGDPRHYDTFWNGVIRWLIRDPELDLLRVRLLQETAPIDTEVIARVEAYRPDYRPAARQRVSVSVRRRGVVDPPGGGQAIADPTELETDAEGRLEVPIVLDQPGVYEVTAEADLGLGRRERGADLVVATDTSPERDRVIADRALVDALAASTGGLVATLDADDAGFPIRPPRVVQVTSTKQIDLWNAPWVMAAVAFVLALEWWLRRKAGFL